VQVASIFSTISHECITHSVVVEYSSVPLLSEKAGWFERLVYETEGEADSWPQEESAMKANDSKQDAASTILFIFSSPLYYFAK
jgi:hypothetical protein